MAPPARPKPQSQSGYEETPDFGAVFQRADNQPPRPNFTGEGLLSEDTIAEIVQADGKCTISLWTLDKDGKPLRNRDGSRRFRLHIEAPYKDSAQANGQAPAEPDDIPF